MLCPCKLSFKHKGNCKPFLTYKNTRNRVGMSNSEKYLKSKSRQTKKVWGEKQCKRADSEH